MTYLISGQELQKALEVIAEIIKPLEKAESVLYRPSDEDLFCYDNVSMMEKLKVSERTLQRYRKNGEIRFIRFGGKIYYPKNFRVLPVEPEKKDYKALINELKNRLQITVLQHKIAKNTVYIKKQYAGSGKDKACITEDIKRMLANKKRKKNLLHFRKTL